jgi:hypothetical protein
MSIELCVFLVMVVSIGLNIYLAQRVIRAHNTTKVLALKNTIRLAVFDKAYRCHELTTRAESLERNLCLRKAEREYKEAGGAAHAIGCPVPGDWRYMDLFCSTS